MEFWSAIGNGIVAFGDFLCGYPLFFLLIGGGLFFLIYSGFTPIRRYGRAIGELRRKDEGGNGQISSLQALASAVAATVGLGNIAGVAIAICIGGPGAIFWMWISAIVGMATKLFEGTLAVMFKGRDSAGELQGGPMYMITTGLGPKWKPLAVFFCIAGLVGSFCLMQANQLTESVVSLFAGGSGTVGLRFGIGLTICLIVSIVIFGGIRRIARVAERIVPVMVILYFLLILYIIFSHLGAVPGVFRDIFVGAFNPSAVGGGVAGGVIFVALTGVRRAALVNEAGIGSASMMHGASRSKEPVHEGLVAMLGPSIDSGFICTLTAIAILVGRSVDPTILPAGGGLSSAQGLSIALAAFDAAIPGIGRYLLFVIVLCFAFSTMFSYSYYGQKCLGFLIGADKAHYYNWPYLLVLIVGAVIPLGVAVSIIDIAFALMAFCTIPTLILLAPKARAAFKTFFANPTQK
ncbi:MAG: alanine:cation symporter family protein [Bacteroidales bacterium]|nr:alanine:cation symporter family protein [Bacteroidales bacterium]